MALSPMMTHYLQVKEKYKDCIVFYRLGDFYEMFFDDAVKVSDMLELTLTGKDCGLKERAPMCGIPYHASDEYIAKLVSLGEKVAICEQVTEPTPNSRTLVEREVVKIVTAGTLTNSNLLDEKANNFLASVYISDNYASISWADLTTGEFYTKSFLDDDFLSELFNELTKISPAEVIGNNKAVEILNNSPLITQKVLPKVQSTVESEFTLNSALTTLNKQFNCQSLCHFGMEDNDICICSAGALISYFKETQKCVLSNITSISCVNENSYMMLDFNTIRNLELIKSLRDGKRYGSLLWVIDKTVTNMGARKLQSYLLSPLHNIADINYRLDGVSCLYNNNLLRESLRDLLKQVKDIKRLTGKISNGTLMPKDCISLMKSLEILPNIAFQLSGCNEKAILDIVENIKDFSVLIALIKESIYDESQESIEKISKKSSIKYIKTGYDKQLDEYRNLFLNGKDAVLEIERTERERTGIKNLKVSYNKVFGYYIEITNSFKDKVPYNYIRRQTLVNGERYVTEELKDLENKIINAEFVFYDLEQKIYNEVKSKLTSYIKDLQITADAVAELDVLCSFATVSKENGYSRPEMQDCKMPLLIKEGRHAVIEKASKQRFIPNDCEIDNNENIINIITGPNMAGKSTYMRQNALIIILAHIGCFVPCKIAKIPLVDRVFTRIGASDNLIFNQSTFMVEMGEMSTILNQATENSFLILDEIGRGTSTFDGLSIAWAIIEFIATNLKAKTLFSTHYHELTELEGKIKGIKNYRITVKEFNGTIIFLRKIVSGGTSKSFGIEVAELAGINKNITSRAKEILSNLEKRDIVKSKQSEDNKLTDKTSEVENILKQIDVNNITPMKAFELLCDLKEKVEDYE